MGRISSSPSSASKDEFRNFFQLSSEYAASDTSPFGLQPPTRREQFEIKKGEEKKKHLNSGEPPCGKMKEEGARKGQKIRGKKRRP